MKQFGKKFFAVIASMAMVIGLFSQVGSVYAAMPEYEIYPKPHKITYENSDFILREKVNVVYENDIDSYTKSRLKEVTDIKGLSILTSDELIDNEKSEQKVTNILIGIKDSNGYVDNYVKNNYSVGNNLFDKTDSYFLKVDNGTVIILGKDTDAAFYGLTTLYHVFNQLEGRTIRNFEVEDYAGVVSRGFIEGYYGNPWSVEDRSELMRWSGYYKLNSYFYAPKDDPKHNANWRDLYTDQEIETMIKPLAQAGNESKCRFVYALHPYMKDATHPNPLRHDANYEADLKVMQDKFAQVIDAGVRQIAILADDAPNVGGSNYIKMLNDMTDWLKEKQKTYPDLKLTLPFCVQEYMGWGQSYFSDFPDNVQIIMTGGQVFGEASENFTNSFMNTVGRGPYLWINWPCTDNSKNHLIMGGYDTFLHPGVNPSKVEGIVLNPMQQSEPSKVAIFGNACYSWNIWQSKAEADEIWNDSFQYVDHNSSLTTQSSKALRELSKHMINQNMIGGDNPVTPLDESVELKPKLDALKSALNSHTATVEQVNELIQEFETLAKASQIYRNSGNQRIKEQIVYWLDCWDDTAGSAIAYLKAVKANIEGDSTTLLNQYSNGQKLFANSRTHALWYRDHYQYAEVGVQRIVPFIKALDEYTSQQVEMIANPDKKGEVNLSLEISNDIVVAQGSLADALDGNKETETHFKAINANAMPVGATVTLDIGSVQDIESVYIAQGMTKQGDILSKAVVEYSQDKVNWTKLDDLAEQTEQTIPASLSARYVRIRNLEYKAIWWRLGEFQVNLVNSGTENTNELKLTASLEHGLRVVTHNSINAAAKNNKIEYMVDGDLGTMAWLASDTQAENGNIQTDDAVVVSFNKEVEVMSVTLNQGSGDRVSNGKVIYQDTDGNWHDWNTFTGAGEEIKITGTQVKAKGIKIVSTENLTTWWQVKEISVEAGVKDYVYTNTETTLLSNTLEHGVALTSGNMTLNAQEYIGVQFKNIKNLDQIVLNYTGNNSALKLQVSKNGIIWTDVTTGVQNEDACFVRFINTGSSALNITINEFKVTYHEILPMQFHSSDIAAIANWGDTRNNGAAFDGNMGTTNKIGGRPMNGQYIIYDLGQEIDMNSLRIYTLDSQNDYIRDAKVQLSTDLVNWNDLFTIGDGIQDTDPNSTARETFTNNDSNYPNYVYAGSDHLNIKGRYLRILMTVDYPQRSIVINEIMVNRGEYIPVENNPQYVGALEERGHQPSYMGDEDLTTTYKSSLANSSMTYYVSRPDGLTSFRIIQNGETTGASVKATFYSDIIRGTTETVEVGKLNQAINEFIIPTGKKLLSIEISWQDKIPEIAEILTRQGTNISVDKTALNNILKETAKSGWTTDSMTAFNNAKKIAEELKNSDYASQDIIDSAVAVLQNAIDTALQKADLSELESLVNEATSIQQNDYTVNSFMEYQNSINDAKSAFNDKDNISVEQAHQFVQDIKNAKNSLEYSSIEREKAELAILDDTTLVESNYAKDSYQNYITAKTALNNAITKDKVATSQADRITPADMKTLNTAFQTAKTALADITELKAVINEFNNYDSQLYTEDSYRAYKDAVEVGKQLLVSGTKETVATQLNLIIEKKNQLVLVSDQLNDVIKEALKIKQENYTEKSYNDFKAVVDEAQALVNPTLQQQKEYIEKITKAKNSLVSIVALKERIQEAEGLDKDKYTSLTYVEVEKAIENAKKAMKDGDARTVKNAYDALTNAIQSLKVSGSKEYVAYLQDLKLKDSHDYTVNSYQAYKNAYDQFMKLPKDVSLEDFMKAKQNLEKYTDSLKYKDADYSQIKDLISKIPSDLSSYNSDSVANLNKVLGRIVYNKTILEQSVVDQYAKDLYQAIQGLTKSSQSALTGDSTYILPMMLTMTIAGCGIYLLRKKKEKNG